MIYILILSLINKVKYKIKMKINEGYYNIVDKANCQSKLENSNWIMLSYIEIAY